MADELDDQSSQVVEAAVEPSDVSVVESEPVLMAADAAPAAASDASEAAEAAQTDAVESGENEDGSSWTKSTEYDITPEMEDPNGASVDETEVTVENTAEGSDGTYHKTEDQNNNTFGIINPKDFNNAIKGQFGGEGYYFRYSNIGDTDQVLIELVDRVTHDVIETITVNPGDQDKSFVSLSVYAKNGEKELSSRPTAPTFNYNANGYITLNWEDGVSNFYHSTLILSTFGGESTNGDTGSGRSDQVIVVAKTIDNTTYYEAVDASSLSENELEKPESKGSYQTTGKEKELATFTETGSSSSTFTPSNVRDIENYEYYDERELRDKDGARYRATGNSTSNYNVMNITTVVDGETLTTRDDLYIWDPSQGADALKYFDQDDVTEIIGYLTVDPGKTEDQDLRALIMNMTHQALIASEYFVSADKATAEQMINPAIMKGYRYILSSNWMKPGTAHEGSLTGYSSSANENGRYEEGIVKLYDVDGNVAYLRIWSGGQEKDGNNATVSTAYGEVGSSNYRIWVLATDEAGTIDAIANVKVDPETGKFLSTFALSSHEGNLGFTDSDDIISVGGTGSTRFYNGRYAPVEMHYYYIEKGGVIIRYYDDKGNVLKEEYVVSVHGSHGDKYSTNDTKEKKPDVIEKDGKTYYYKLQDTTEKVEFVDSINGYESINRREYTATENGLIQNGTQKVITYIYSLKGDVIVHYEDEDGNKIAKTVVDTEEDWVDTEYDTTDNKPKIIEYEGKRYELVRIKKDSAPENGKVVEGTTEVTYVYRLIEDPVTPEDPTPVAPKEDPAPVTPAPVYEANVLPQTGDTDGVALTGFAALLSALGIGMASRKRKSSK